MINCCAWGKFSKVSSAERGQQPDWAFRWELSLPIFTQEGAHRHQAKPYPAQVGLRQTL